MKQTTQSVNNSTPFGPAKHFIKKLLKQDPRSLKEKAKRLKRKKRKFTPPPNDGKVRLNLGCGDKLLEGYTNVDIVTDRKGKVPDIICDIRDLKTIDENYADQILAVHVIEHFYYWEAEEILKEWMRVLKPGGEIILECPNLQYAAKKFLENPEKFSEPEGNGQQTMWVFYGDPQWKDPLMVHRWGYTPHSLQTLLEKTGFTNVRQEPAIFKMQEPRDMRIVGQKK